MFRMLKAGSRFEDPGCRIGFRNGFWVDVRWDDEFCEDDESKGPRFAQVSCGSAKGLIALRKNDRQDTTIGAESEQVMRLMNFVAGLARRAVVDVIDLAKI